jgi:hypothetical protein
MKSRPLLLAFLLAACSAWASAQADDPVKKLGAFLGKWQAEGTRGTEKITSAMECRWSSQGMFLVCEQSISMAAGDHRQLTVYSYNPKESTYSYVTIADPGAKPTSGRMEIKGNVWTYPFSFENNGKTIQIRTTNEFIDSRTEVYKTESSDDGGASWKTILQGTAHKVGD